MLRSIKKRVSKLEGKLGRKQGAAVIIGLLGETREEAMERHFREHPEDREREVLIIILWSQAVAAEEPSGGPPLNARQEQPQDKYRGGLPPLKPLQITS